MHVGGAGMSPEVAGAGLVDSAVIQEFFDPVTEVGGAEAAAVAAEKERCLAGQMVEERTGLHQKAIQPGGGTLAKP